MNNSTLPATRTALIGVATALTALAVAACSGPTNVISPVGPVAGAQAVHRDTSPSQTPYPFTYQTIDDPSSPDFTRVTGINSLGKIVGYWGSGSQSDPAHGFDAASPYTKFTALNYPGAVNTFPSGLSTNNLIAGYFLDDFTGEHTWGFMQNHGIWTLYKDHMTPKGPSSVCELLAVNNSTTAVGFYTDSYGINHPFELAVPKFHNFKPPGFVSSEATGINLRGDVTGTGSTASGNEGWLLRNGTYYDIAYPGATATSVLSLSWQDQVVGSYVDSKGTHGFVLSSSWSYGNRYWQSIDEPKAAGTTVVTGINNHHEIVGWYIDADGHTNGFAATIPRN